MAEKEAKTFNQKLMAAMSEMENPKKEKEGYNYKYETLEQVLGIVRPALYKHGLMFTQMMKWNGQCEAYVLETVIFDENEGRTVDVRPMPNFSDAQQAGSWETYMRRYSLRTVFGLTGEDDDGAATLGKATSIGKPMTEKQEYVLMSLVNELADMRGKSDGEVIEALMCSNVMNGATFETLTTKQASTAIDQLQAWKSKAIAGEGMADSDIEF